MVIEALLHRTELMLPQLELLHGKTGGNIRDNHSRSAGEGFGVLGNAAATEGGTGTEMHCISCTSISDKVGFSALNANSQLIADNCRTINCETAYNAEDSASLLILRDCRDSEVLCLKELASAQSPLITERWLSNNQGSHVQYYQKMYASGGGTPLRVIRIKNADLPNGYLAYAQAYEDVVVIDETGTALMAEATAMALQLPAKSDNTTQTLDFQIDNVSGRALGYVKRIETGGHPIEVSLLTYSPNDFSQPAEQVLVMDGKSVIDQR